MRSVMLRVSRSGVRSWSGAAIAAAACLGLLCAAAGRAADEPSWEIQRADVRVTCPMTVGGSFEAKTNALTGSVTLTTPQPPTFSGTLTVDLRTLQTGISLRDSHMREKYLEVDKGEAFTHARLSDIKLADVDPDTFVGRTQFTGQFQLHGTTRPIEGQVEIRRAGSTIHLDATFPVKIPDFGIPKPRYLGVGVKDRVQVHVSFDASPATSAGGEQ
jgi:polyisoprenoid-binding protein YceI